MSPPQATSDSGFLLPDNRFRLMIGRKGSYFPILTVFPIIRADLAERFLAQTVARQAVAAKRLICPFLSELGLRGPIDGGYQAAAARSGRKSTTAPSTISERVTPVGR